MRGKNILWFALAAMLLSVPLVSVRAQETPTNIYVDPPETTGLLPGDAFGVNIIITGGLNVYAWEFQLTYYPYMQVIVVTDVIEGDFLMMAGDKTFMTKNIDHFRGNLRVGGTIVGDVPGVSGDGILCTIMFVIIEAGECPLDLHDVILLDPQGNSLPYTLTDGYYLGPTADFINLPYANERPHAGGKEQAAWVHSMIKKGGESFEFVTDITNTGYAPVYARLVFTTTNQKTGESLVLRSGQQYMSQITTRQVVLYVNEFKADFDGWTKVGVDPYLDTADTTSYIEADTHCKLSGGYGFQDIDPASLGPMDQIVNVQLEGYTRADTTVVDYDVLVAEPDWSFTWLGSLWGEPTWGWKSPRWVGSDTVSTLWPSALDVESLNALTLVLHHYLNGHVELSCMRLIVTIQTGGTLGSAMYYLIEPGATVTPDAAIWYLLEADNGKYYTTVSIQFKYIEPAPGIPQFWTVSEHTFTFEWWCKGTL